MKIAAAIVAAGRGSRAGGETPKQYRLLGGRPVIARTLAAFADHPAISRIVTAIHPDDAALFAAAAPDAEWTPGGVSRSESVRACLNALATDAPDAVLIHDAARPFVSTDVINAVIARLADADGAVPVLPLSDALLRGADGRATAPADRTGLHRAQTPQGFRFAALKAAYDALPPGADMADDAAVALAAGLKLAMVAGDADNVKLTFPDDFARAGARLAQTGGGVTVGFGFDVHRLEPGPGMTLCGVRIEEGFSLVGHSDADAGLHALTDAILGAAGLGDIGQHFPPSDPQWKGAASDRFLVHALSLLESAGGRLSHADITLICERPKIGPYREAMRARLADILRLPIARVSVKATTTEGLGFTGRGEGLAAQAVATVTLA